MQLHPRRHTSHVHLLFGRSLQSLRHSLDSGSGFSQDGLISTARDFNNNTTQKQRTRGFYSHCLTGLAWLAGAALAVVYLLWFFKNIFEHTVR
ncbi:MAG: hypothetical protein JNM22_15790 [Saprospiraceae bacterium]|nr:hypothetical protein [Saprospiraceae bacterium]